MNEKILVIDDEIKIRQLLSESLKLEGFDVISAENGQVGLELLKAENPQIVLLDLKMPVLNGHQFVEAVTVLSKKPIIIVISGWAEIEEVVRLMKQGATDYIVKPVNLDDLLVKIRKSLELQELKEMKRQYETKRLLYFDQLYKAFDWKKIIRDQHKEKLGIDFVDLIYFTFTDRTEITSLILILNIILKNAKKLENSIQIEITDDQYQVIDKTVNNIKGMIKCFAKAMNIINENSFQEGYITVTEMKGCIENFSDSVKEFLSIKNQKIVIQEIPEQIRSKYLRIYPDKCCQVFNELLINAMKYSRDNDKIHVFFNYISEYLEIDILNPAYPNENGETGIPEKYQDLIFEPFFRICKATDSRYTSEEFGYGLGLAVVKSICDNSDVKINIFNIKGYTPALANDLVSVTLRFTLFDDCKNLHVNNLMEKPGTNNDDIVLF